MGKENLLSCSRQLFHNLIFHFLNINFHRTKLNLQSKYMYLISSSKLHTSGSTSDQQKSAPSAPKTEYGVTIYNIARHAVINWITKTTAYSSRDSAVGIATGYGLDDLEVGVQVPLGSRIFSSPRRPNRFCRPPCLLSNGTGGSGYGLDDLEVGIQVPLGSRIFSSPRRPNRFWRPPCHLSNGTGGSYPGGKATGTWSCPLNFN
jgi:hypothetical protein